MWHFESISSLLGVCICDHGIFCPERSEGGKNGEGRDSRGEENWVHLKKGGKENSLPRSRWQLCLFSWSVSRALFQELWELSLHSPTENRNPSAAPSPSLCLHSLPRREGILGSRKGWDGTRAEAELSISRVEPQSQRLWGLFGGVTTKPNKIAPKTQQQQEKGEREMP